MIIACSPCSGGPLREGNRSREAGRSPPERWEAKEVEPLDCERVSLSESEPVSASLRLTGSGQPAR